MALSATFTANFSSFFDAVDKADIKLKELGGGAEKAGVRLNAMATQFSGQKIIQEASLMVKAIGDIENISKLTEKEIGRLGATTNEAVDKMKRLGLDVPKNLQAIADKTKVVDKAGMDWMGTLTKVAGAVGIAFSVDAVVAFVGEVFGAASAIKDLSNQWGVSTEAVQQWTAAAKGSGVEAKTVGNSVQFMTTQLAEGSDKYKASLENVGLSYEKLRKIPVEDAYRQIVEAIAAVEDGTLQLDVAIGLLGPNAKQMIGAINDGFLEAADKQKVMSDETIKRLTDAEAKWKQFRDNVVTYTGEMLGAAMGRQEIIFKSWDNFLVHMGKVTQDMITGGHTAGDWLAQQRQIATTTELNDDLTAALYRRSSGNEAVNKKLKTQAQIDAELKAKEDALRKAQQEREKAQEKLNRETEAYTKKLEANDEKINDLIDSFGGTTGSGAIGKANDYLKAISMAIPIEQMSAKAKLDIHKAMDEAIVSYQAAGQMAPKVMYDIWLATRNATEGVIEFSSKWLNFSHLVTTNPIDLGPGFTMAAPPDLTPLERFGTSVGRISTAIGDIGKMGGGTFSEIAGAIGGVAGGLQAGALAAEDFDKALKNFKPGADQDIAKGMADTAAAAVVAAASFLQMTEGATVLQSTLTGAAMGASLAPGPYMAYGAAIGAVVGYIRGLHTASEDTISNLNKMKYHIAEGAGGWEALGKAAKNAGADAEYAALHNAESAQEIQWAAEALGKELEYQATALDKVTEAAERYGITIEELGPAMQRQELDAQAQQLYHDFEILNKAGIESVAITGRMSDAVSIYVQDALRMGIEVPAAMKPMLEQFAKSGELLDENGDAITSLEDSGINFAMTMSDGFKAMVDEVKKLTDAISRGLGLAIENIPQPVIKGRVEWDGGRATPENIPRPNDRPGGGMAPEYARGTDGFVNFGRGTPVILHGWEAVVPRGDAALATVTGGGGGAAGGGAMPAIVINAQGAFFNSPADLQRLADRVGDALTAKYSVMGKLRAAV